MHQYFVVNLPKVIFFLDLILIVYRFQQRQKLFLPYLLEWVVAQMA